MNKEILAILIAALAASAAQSAEVPDKKIGSFTVSRTTDAMSDKVIIAAQTDATDSDRKSVLAWRCQDNKPQLVYDFNVVVVGVRNYVTIQFRVDQTPANPLDVWRILPGGRNRAAFLAGEHESELKKLLDFTNSVRKGSKVLIEITDLSNQRTFRDTFDLEGLTDALKELDCMQQNAT